MQYLENIRRFVVQHRIDIALVFLVFFVAFVPRILDLGTFLTADEKNWTSRSYEFIRAFKDLRFNDMLQTTHPGVTTMWLIGSGVVAKMIVSDIPYSYMNITHFVKAAQMPIALVHSLLVPAIYLMLKVLFADRKRMRWAALVASLFIALDPFLIGHSRVAHVDALLAELLFMTCIGIIIYVNKGYSRKWLVLSAVFCAFAILTKIPAIFAFPFFVFAVLTVEGKKLFRRDVMVQRFRDFVIWSLIILVIILVLWPAILWAPDPSGNVELLGKDIGRAAITPHDMTESYSIQFLHYPAALLTRTSPITFIFSFIMLFWVVRRYAMRRKLPDTTLLLLLAYVFFFIVMMTFGAKKGDRYVLPVFLAIDVIAVLGMSMVVRLFFTRLKRNGFVILSAIAVVFLAGTAFWYHPYAIAYSNPLFPDNLSQELGWGEGLEQAGAWFSENAPESALISSWYPRELLPYVPNHVVDLNSYNHAHVRYVVLYKNMFGRADDHPATDFIDEYYNRREPVHVVEIAGKEFVWIYEKQAYEKVVGELVSGMSVGQELVVEHDPLVGVDVRFATYSGRAQSGVVTVELKDVDDGFVLYHWDIPVSEIEDDAWRTLLLPYEQEMIGKNVAIEVSAIGVSVGDAPTVRYTSAYDYREGNMYVSGQEREGDLAVRLRYEIEGGSAISEESLLLSR